MRRLVGVADHLSVAELEDRFRRCRDGREKIHLQAKAQERFKKNSASACG
jgi:hypothetical protein